MNGDETLWDCGRTDGKLRGLKEREILGEEGEDNEPLPGFQIDASHYWER